MTSQPTHVAYADESHYTSGRYRAVGMLSTSINYSEQFGAKIVEILNNPRIAELKYGALKQARVKDAAIRVLEELTKVCKAGHVRVDVLIWDMQDTRHQGVIVDDIANLQRMYHHLFKAVLLKRWPDTCRWLIRPDQNLSVAWNDVEYFLRQKEIYIQEEAPSIFNPDSFSALMKTGFKVEKIEPMDSKAEVLIQVADLVAGLAVKSRTSFEEYMQWYPKNSQQGQFNFTDDVVDTSDAEHNRFTVIQTLRRLCGQHKLGVSLKSSGGLKTIPVSNPISFWLWEPQGDHDKAPTKENTL